MNLCYLECLNTVLPYVIDVNLEFQSEKPKIHLLYSRVSTLFKTIAECYLKPEYVKNTPLDQIEFKNPRHFVTLNNVYMGPKIAAKFCTNQFTEIQKTDFTKRCIEFYIELLSQICKRFPFNSELIKGL